MPYLPDRAHDIFISYAHADDTPSPWVSSFAKFLKATLNKKLRLKENGQSVDVEIWKDHLLPQQGSLSERLENEVKESSILLVVMSKSYLYSDWCKQEGMSFVKSLQGRSYLRIFVVSIEKTEETWPSFLLDPNSQRLLSREFYQEAEVGKFRTIPMKDEQGYLHPMANEILNDLAEDLSDVLYQFKHHPPSEGNPKIKSVFVRENSAVSRPRVVAYDVFISFKNLDEKGVPTRDAALANEVYNFLTSKGLNVFISTVTLESLGVSNYKKAIDEALDAASIMVAVGTSTENLNSEWVRYEWDGFYNDILSGVKPSWKALYLCRRSAPGTTSQDVKADADICSFF